MLISGVGHTFNPQESTLIDTIHIAYKKFEEQIGERPTHVSIPSSATEEDKRLISRGLGLIIANSKFRMPMVIVGVEKELYDGKEQGERQPI
jgi:hypothetical protein